MSEIENLNEVRGMVGAAQVVRHSLLSLQVCVPKGWSDDQVLGFAEGAQPCGTENGWFIRREGDDALKGMPERVPCLERDGFVHVMLDC